MRNLLFLVVFVVLFSIPQILLDSSTEIYISSRVGYVQKFCDNRTIEAEIKKVFSKEGYPMKINASFTQQIKINYAWEESKDPRFIYLLEAENGTYETFRKSKTYIIRQGVRYHDIGVCQMNEYWQKKNVNNKNFSDYKWQIRKCYYLYSTGTTFYGINNIKKTKTHFYWN